MLTEGPCLAHYAKDKDNIVTTDASTTGLRITLWQKEDDGNTKPIAFGSRYLNDTEKKFFIGELELLAVVWGLEKFRFYLYGKKVYLLEYCTPAWLDDIIVVTQGNKQDHEKKLFDVLNKLEKAGYRASKKKSEFFMNRIKWLGHEVDENGIKPNEEKIEAIQKLKPPEIISWGDTIHGKILTETFGTNRPTTKVTEKE